MHACSWYCGSEAPGCRTLRLESQSSAGLRMQPYPRAPDLVWPGHVHGKGCLSAQAMDTGFGIFVWRLCLGPGCASVWVSVSPPALDGVSVGCVWARVVVAPFFSRLRFAVFAVGLWFRPASHHSWLRFWGVCGCVRAPRVLRRSRSGARCGCVCLDLGFGCAPPVRGEVLGCVCVCVLFLRGPLHLLAEDAVPGCVLGPGLLPRPASPG